MFERLLGPLVHPSSLNDPTITAYSMRKTMLPRPVTFVSPSPHLQMMRGPRRRWACGPFGTPPMLMEFIQRQRDAVADEIRRADASKLVPGLSETELIQQLVSNYPGNPCVAGNSHAQ